MRGYYRLANMLRSCRLAEEDAESAADRLGFLAVPRMYVSVPMAHFEGMERRPVHRKYGQPFGTGVHRARAGAKP